MGAAALSGHAVRLLFGGFRASLRTGPALAGSAFLADFAAVTAGSVLVVTALVLSANELRTTAANVPLAFVEGALTLFIVLFFARAKPDVLELPLTFRAKQDYGAGACRTCWEIKSNRPTRNPRPKPAIFRQKIVYPRLESYDGKPHFMINL
jgi:hypothetical protein